MVEALTCRN